MTDINWAHYPNFKPTELACKHCRKDGITSEMMDVLQDVRTRVEIPFTITSGYRCPNHPIEQEKATPGEHTLGMAVDILCHGQKALDIIKFAQYCHVKRIGIHQKGNVNGRFVHLGIADRFSLNFPAAIWTY